MDDERAMGERSLGNAGICVCRPCDVCQMCEEVRNVIFDILEMVQRMVWVRQGLQYIAVYQDGERDKGKE